MLMILHAPSAMAASACSSVWMHSSRQIGVCSFFCSCTWPYKSSQPSGCSIIIKWKASSCCSSAKSSRRYAELASTISLIRGNSCRSRFTGSKSFPGLILILMRWYPAASSFFTAATSSSSDSLIPTDTPEAISSRAPPNNFASGTPRCFASASQTAVSNAALAMLCPRTGSSSAQTSAAAENLRSLTNGQTCSRRMCHAVSVVSGLYPGASPATHSPQPITPSTFASTNTIRRTSVRIVLVSNGATSFIRSSRKVISRICIVRDLFFPQLRSLKIAPRRQKIRSPRGIGPHSHRSVSAREPIRELFPQARLHTQHFLRITPLPFFQRARDLNRRRSFLRHGSKVIDGRDHSLRVQPPLRHQPIRGNSPMQRARRHAIKVLDVSPADRAQPVQIEMRILQFQRIKRPLNQSNAPPQRLFSLEQFQAAPHAAIAIIGAHSRLMRMQVNAIFAKADQRQRISHQPFAVERPQDLSPGDRRHHEHRHRLHFQVRLAPNLALQVHARLELFQRRALSHNDALAHRFCAASLSASSLSRRFAASHNDSISIRGTFSKARPLARASRSISRNLRENFAFAFFSAISGSTCRNRARFTAANSKSPISSSTFAPSFVSKACRSSAHSSRIFSKIPAASSQSKPTRAAFFVNCKPSSVAGNVRGTPSSKDFSAPVARGRPFSVSDRRSCALICSQFLSTSAASLARFSPNTCGWRRTIFSCTSRITSATVNRPSSAAICE